MVAVTSNILQVENNVPGTKQLLPKLKIPILCIKLIDSKTQGRGQNPK